MHFALPPRKSSRPPPYLIPKPSHSPWLRRVRWRNLALLSGVALFLIILLSQLRSGRTPVPVEEFIQPGGPPVVIVTPIDMDMDEEYRDMVLKNRESYISRHGYSKFTPDLKSYETRTINSKSWAKIPAVRHAMTIFPHSTYFFYLDARSLIMNPLLSIEADIFNSSKLEVLMLRDQPIAPPDGVIKTRVTMTAKDVDLVISQDHEGLAQNSFIIRQGEWAKYFLDSWHDPLYRKYNFQRADAHALEHLVQWHTTILAKLAIIPQNMINSYYKGKQRRSDKDTWNYDAVYSPGEFVANLYGCDRDPNRDCDGEMVSLYKIFQDSQPES